MTIDQAYRLVNFVANKEQRGQVLPTDFNILAVEAQIEAICNILGNVKTADGRFIPRIGYKVNQQAKEMIQPLIVRKASGMNFVSPFWDYPADYLSFDHLERIDGTLITTVESDQLGGIKQSKIHPPTAEYPFACLHGEGIEIVPSSVTDQVLFYVKRPVDPNWDYTIAQNAFVFNSSATPQLSGKISQDFQTSPRMHRNICMIILKYIGINLSDVQLTAFATEVERTT